MSGSTDALIIQQRTVSCPRHTQTVETCLLDPQVGIWSEFASSSCCRPFVTLSPCTSHDDGSSEYHDDQNIVYLGGYKYRDGINRNMTGNLMIESGPVFQVFGFNRDYFDNNYLLGHDPVCGPPDIGGLSGNTYITVNGTRQPHDPRFLNPSQKCDPGETVAWSVEEIEALARSLVGLP